MQMYRHLIPVALAAFAATAQAQNTATFNLSITSANGGADSLFSWSYTGTPTIQMPSGGAALNSLILASGSDFGSAGPAFNASMTSITGLDTGLVLTNPRTGDSVNLTGFRFLYDSGTTQAFVQFLNPSQVIVLQLGDQAVLSGPNAGSYLSSIDYAAFNEGQWTRDFVSYLNFDPVLTVGLAPIPETSTYGLALGGLALAAAALRRRRKA